MKKLISVIMIIALLALALVSCDLMPTEHTLSVGRVVVEKEGETAEVVCALILNQDGKIALARIDEITYETIGEGTVAPTSKKAQGDSYGMVAYGGVKYEWYEQISYLEHALVGKTLEQAMTIETRGEEIVSGCTISVDNYIAAVKAAFESKDKKAFEMSGDPSLALTIGTKVNGDNYISAVSAAALFRMQVATNITLINSVSVIPEQASGQ